MKVFLGLIFILVIAIPHHCLIIKKISVKDDQLIERETELAKVKEYEMDYNNITLANLIHNLRYLEERDYNLFEAFTSLNDRLKNLELKNSLLLKQVIH